MLRKSFFVALAILFTAGLVAGTDVFAQAYPSKPVTVIVPYSAGGSSDLLARAVERIWPKYCSQPIVIVNKTGGGGVVGTQFVVTSKPDGYTVLFAYGSGCDTVMPHLQKMPYKVYEDLIPVARLSIHSVAICVGQKSQFKTLSEMIDWAKNNKKPLTSSVSTKAGAVDIALTALSKASGVKIVTVPFSGGADAVTALAGGHVMIGGGHPAEILPHIKSGRFIPIGIATPERDPVLPNIPTLKEQGYDISTWGSIKGVAVPKGTPREVVTYLEDIFKKISEDQEFKKIMADMAQPVQYLNGPDFGKFLQVAFADYGKLIKDLNIKL